MGKRKLLDLLSFFCVCVRACIDVLPKKNKNTSIVGAMLFAMPLFSLLGWSFSMIPYVGRQSSCNQ